MQVALTELVVTRKISHPTRFVSLKSECHADLRIEIHGFPWWLESPSTSDTGDAVLHFEGISSGTFDCGILEADWAEEDLEWFDVRPLASRLWAKGVNCEVFCHSKLNRPLDVYATLHDYLNAVACPYGPSTYLNMGDSGSLAAYAEIAQSNSFLLCRGPEAICAIVCVALEKQNAKFNLVRGGGPPHELIWASIGRSQFTCTAAYLTWDE
jgi:hypothetical protein